VYAGLAATATAAGLLLLRRRPAATPPTNIPRLPTLAAQPRVRPGSQPGKGERCARCGTRSGKDGWYRIEGKSYCRDCAPRAAREAGLELAPALPDVKSTSTAQRGRSIPTPAKRTLSPVGYLPPERRVRLRLRPAPIRLNVGQGADGQPAWYTSRQGYVALREDGRDTGLAITPSVRIGALRPDGTQEVSEDTSEWLITHIPSGKTLGNRAFSSMESARQLAGILAQLDWTREAHQITDREVNQVNRTFQYYSAALEQESQRRERAATTGQLIADNIGGLARVLEDRGETLFVADSYGRRYEIGRDEVRQPAQADFRLARIAQPLAAQELKGRSCRQCGAPASGAGPGARWYRMDYRDFCPACAGEYAGREGFEMPETVGSESG